MMSYNWLRDVVHKSTGGEKEARFIIPENQNENIANGTSVPMAFLIVKLLKENPEVEGIELHYPNTAEESFYVEISNSNRLYYDSDFQFFDQNTLEEIETPSIYGKC